MLARQFDRLSRRLGLEPHERRLLLLMGALVAILLCAYTIAKVLRDSLLLAEFGALALPYAYIAVALASAGFVWLESRMARRFTRLGATRFNQYAAIGFSLLAVVVFPHARHWTAAAFYVWTGSQAMMLLPHFWVLALDVWDSRRARRVFPLLSGCGLIGGLAGGGLAWWLTPIAQHVGLMWILSGFLIVGHVLTRVIERHRAHRSSGPLDSSSTVSGWQLVRRSRYVKFLAAGLALSVVVSTLVDFQFKFFVQRTYPDPHALTQFLGQFYVVLNALALVFQFGAAGWLLERLGLGVATGLQPSTVMLFATWVAISPGWWVVAAMRWLQGVISQTIGKSSAEIYFGAMPPSERRRIKPAIDTLVERWADAAVGVLLIIVLRAMGVGFTVLAGVTAGVAAVWLLVLLGLHHEYGRAFRAALSSRWLEPEAAPESMRIPSARKALLQALRADDERRIVLALKLCESARHPDIARAVTGCLQHPSLAVRAAAVRTMEALRLPDLEGATEVFLGETDEGLVRASVSYLLAMSPRPTGFVCGLLEGDDPALRRYVLDVLFDRPFEAPGALTTHWIDARLASGTREDKLLAARALGVIAGSSPVRQLGELLRQPDVDLQRVALHSARRRPSPLLLESLVPLLLVPELSYDARQAIAAIGDLAVPELTRHLGGARGARAQVLAARTLAQIGSARARDTLMTLVRSRDPRLRYLGLRGMTRMRSDSGRPVLPRSTAHTLFLRELRGYRVYVEQALRLEGHAAPEVRLLADSYDEFAAMALERAVQALACWYEARPLFGVFTRLKSREAGAAAPALEYLDHVLPRRVFDEVCRIFDEKARIEPMKAESGNELAESIRAAWRSEDGWLRACAVRASRAAPTLDLRVFVDDPIVRLELGALFAADDRRRAAAVRAVLETPSVDPAC